MSDQDKQRLNSKAQAAIDALLEEKNALKNKSKERETARDILRHVFETNPALADQLNDALEKGTFKQFTLNAPEGIGGSYRAGEQNVNMHLNDIIGAYKQSPFNSNEFAKAQHADALIFTLGHELKHAQNASINAQGKVKAMGVDAFEREIDQIAQSNQPGARDYTAAIAKRIQVERMDESSAQIAGWNTLMAAKKQENPNITPLQVAQGLGLKPGQIGSYFFDEKGNHVPGLTFNPDGSITDNAANREAEARAYYDQPASRVQLGATKTDYRNAGADEWISKIIAAEDKYADKHAANSYAQINMDSLGLRQADIQAQGVVVESFKPGASAKIVDSSNPQNPKTMHFYNEKGVPEGYPATTPGLPHEQQQQHKTDARQQGATQTNQTQHTPQAANDAQNPSQTRYVDHAAMWADSMAVGQQYAQAQQLQNPTIGARV